MIPTSCNPVTSKAFMQLIDPVVTEIMTKERLRLKKVLASLVERNMELMDSKDGFLLYGEVYTHFPRKVVRHNDLKEIHPSLRDEAEDYKNRQETLQRDSRRIRQALAVIVPRCESRQQIRDALPEAISSQITEFQGMERQNPEGFILEAMPHLKKQYEQAMNLAIAYMAYDLIF